MDTNNHQCFNKKEVGAVQMSNLQELINHADAALPNNLHGPTTLTTTYARGDIKRKWPVYRCIHFSQGQGGEIRSTYCAKKKKKLKKRGDYQYHNMHEEICPQTHMKSLG